MLDDILRCSSLIPVAWILLTRSIHVTATVEGDYYRATNKYLLHKNEVTVDGNGRLKQTTSFINQFLDIAAKTLRFKRELRLQGRWREINFPHHAYYLNFGGYWLHLNYSCEEESCWLICAAGKRVNPKLEITLTESEELDNKCCLTYTEYEKLPNCHLTLEDVLREILNEQNVTRYRTYQVCSCCTCCLDGCCHQSNCIGFCKLVEEITNDSRRRRQRPLDNIMISLETLEPSETPTRDQTEETTDPSETSMDEDIETTVTTESETDPNPQEDVGMLGKTLKWITGQ